MSLQSKTLSRAFSSTRIPRHQFFSAQPSLWSSSQQPYMTPEKTIALAIWTFVSKVMSLHFNTPSGFVIAFLSRSKLKFMSIELVMLSNHLILYRCLLLLPSIFPSISVFYNGLALCIRLPKYWSFGFSNSPSKECSKPLSVTNVANVFS